MTHTVSPRTDWNDRDCSEMELTEALAFWRDHHNAGARHRAAAAIRYYRDYHSPNRLTEQQKAWARQHDWYVCDLPNGCIMVQSQFTANGGPLQVFDLAWKRSFAELRAWAGY